MAPEPTWRSDELLAFTDHDGPGRPPSGGERSHWLALAGVLALVAAGVLFSDALGVDDRPWVETLGLAAVVGAAASAVALVRGSAAAPLVALLSSAGGTVFGVVDALSDTADRGRVIAVAFALTTAGSGWLVSRQQVPRRWEDEQAYLVDAETRAADIAAMVGEAELDDLEAGYHGAHVRPGGYHHRTREGRRRNRARLRDRHRHRP